MDDNWKAIVAESEHLIGRIFMRHYDNELYVFFGLVHGDDDYYYGFSHSVTHSVVLASCVGSITQGFTMLIKEKH